MEEEKEKKVIELPTIIRDSREHENKGYKFIKSATCAGMEIQALEAGDYALKDFPELIVIERKQSIDELIGNLGKNRERFERELEKLQKVKFKYIIVEDYYSSIFKQSRYSKMSPQSIFGSIISLWIKYNIPFIFVGGHDTGHNITRSLLLKAYKYRMEGKV